MKYRPSRNYLIVAGLLAFGLVMGEIYFRLLVHVGGGETVPLAAKLETIPKTLGDWTSIDNPIAPDMLMKIGAEDTLSRDYSSPARHGVGLHLYIAYFGGVRGTAPHHPDICMPGAGYDRIDGALVTLALKGFDQPVEVHQDVFERTSDQQKRLVVWWEYVYGENVASRTMQRLKWVLPGFMGGKRGSILQVQVGTEFSGDPDERMKLVMAFIDCLGPEIKRVLPKPASTEGVADAKGAAGADR